jgi:hypothetical protein
LGPQGSGLLYLDRKPAVGKRERGPERVP